MPFRHGVSLKCSVTCNYILGKVPGIYPVVVLGSAGPLKFLSILLKNTLYSVTFVYYTFSGCFFRVLFLPQPSRYRDRHQLCVFVFVFSNFILQPDVLGQKRRFLLCLLPIPTQFLFQGPEKHCGVISRAWFVLQNLVAVAGISSCWQRKLAGKQSWACIGWWLVEILTVRCLCA